MPLWKDSISYAGLVKQSLPRSLSSARRHTAKQDLGQRIISQADHSLIPSIKKLVVVAEWAAGGQ